MAIDPLDGRPLDDGQDKDENALTPPEGKKPVTGKGPGPKDGSGARERSRTTRMINNTKEAAKEKPRHFTGLFVGAGIVVVALIAVAAIVASRGQAAVTAPPPARFGYETSEDIDSKFATFMKTIESEMPELRNQVEAIAEQSNASEQRMNELVNRVEIAREADERRLKTALQEIRGMLEERGAQGSGNDQDLEGFIAVLRRQKDEGSGLTLSEARVRLEQWLRNAGFAGPNLASLRDRSLDQLGFLYVGDVAEEALSDEELAQLPDALRGVVRELAAHLETTGRSAGKVLFREEEALAWLRAKLGDTQVTGEQLKAAAYMARVRRENVTREQEEMLPELAQMRDRSGIAAGDLFRVEALVHRERKRWPLMTPGQHLSLTEALGHARKVDTKQRGTSAAPIKIADLEAINGAIRDAVRTAIGQGVRSQPDLLRRAQAAGLAKAEALDVNVVKSDLDRMVINAVANAVRATVAAEQGGSDEAGADTGGSARGNSQQQRSQAAPVQVPELRLGPIAVREAQVARYAWLVTTMAAERLEVDPNTPEGASALATAWSLAPVIGQAAWQSTLSNDGTLRDFTRQILVEMQQLISDGRSLGAISGPVRGIPEEHAGIVRGVMLGLTFADMSESGDPEATQTALKRTLKELRDKGVRLRAADLNNQQGYERVAMLITSLGGSVLPVVTTRVDMVAGVLSEQVIERQAALEQITLAGKDRAMQERLIRSLTDDLLLALPGVLVGLEDGRMPEDMLRRLVITGTNRWATASTAEVMLQGHGTELISDLLAAAADSDDVLPLIYGRMSSWIPDAIHETLEETRPEITDSTIGKVAADVKSRLKDGLEQELARGTIWGNLSSRVKSTTGSLDRAGQERALIHLSTRLEETTVKPLTLRRLDETSQALYAEVLDVIAGRISPRLGASERAPSSGRRSSGGPTPVRPAFQEVKDIGLPGLPIGSRTETINGDRVLKIPVGSQLYVTLETGAVLPVNNSNTSNVVQLRGVGGFYSAAGNWYPLPPVIIQGTMTPNLGGDRIEVELKSLTLELPNGRTITKEITGIVVDQVDGVAGMLAEFHRNWEKIMPEAGTLAILQGVSSGLAAQESTVEVTGQGSTIATTQSGSAVSQGVSDGFQAGVDLLSEYTRNYLDAISPTLEAPNGQPLTAVLTSEVTYPELTAVDWSSLASLSTEINDGF
ncbi:MAG: hypothetical protein PF961_10565 [Planctomycetota bacterium]|jgi:DNA-binding HxlR family transcriptional regulator|nr:hypothetical protein [Planctomycetota bacterium]